MRRLKKRLRKSKYDPYARKELRKLGYDEKGRKLEEKREPVRESQAEIMKRKYPRLYERGVIGVRG